MQAPNWLIFFFIYLTFAGCQSSAANLDAGQGDTPQSSQPVPSKAALLDAIFNYLFQLYPSSESGSSSSLRWNDGAIDSSDEYMLGTPKRFFYPPRAGKRSYPFYDDEAVGESAKEGDSKPSDEGSRWKRSVPETQQKEDDSRRTERDAPQSNDDDQEDSASTSWWWTQATVRRSPFSPRLGKRDDVQYGVLYDDDYPDVDDVSDDDSDNDLEEGFVISDYSEEALSPQRLSLRSALVPRLGKRDFAFSPRLGKRVTTAFIPRLGKKDFAFSPRLGKRGDFAFSPRLGKKADFAFSPRLGKRGDFAFSPRLGKRGDFPFKPRTGKRVNAFSPRLGKRDQTSASSASSSSSSSPEETWRPNTAQVHQRSVAFSPRLG